MPRRLLFAARKQHIDAVEIGFGGCWIKFERFVEGPPRAHHMNLSAESVARILQLGDAQARPRRRKACNPKGHVLEQRVRTIQITPRAGTHHK